MDTFSVFPQLFQGRGARIPDRVRRPEVFDQGFDVPACVHPDRPVRHRDDPEPGRRRLVSGRGSTRRCGRGPRRSATAASRRKLSGKRR